MKIKILFDGDGEYGYPKGEILEAQQFVNDYIDSLNEVEDADTIAFLNQIDIEKAVDFVAEIWDVDYEWYSVIKEKYHAFVKANGCEPRYADVSVIFEDDKECRIDGYTISLVSNSAEEDDENIFFYCDSVDDLISLTEWGREDFIIIEDSVEFTNVI